MQAIYIVSFRFTNLRARSNDFRLKNYLQDRVISADLIRELYLDENKRLPYRRMINCAGVM